MAFCRNVDNFVIVLIFDCVVGIRLYGLNKKGYKVKIDVGVKRFGSTVGLSCICYVSTNRFEVERCGNDENSKARLCSK